MLAQTRAHEHTWELFDRHVLQHLDADLALCVGDGPGEGPGNPFHDRARYVWRHPELDDWGQAVDRAAKIEGVGDDWRRLVAVGDQWLGGLGPGPDGAPAHPGSAGILLVFRWLLRRALQADGVLEEYDRFVLTRSDFRHEVPHPPLPLLEPDRIWLPNGQLWSGVTDRHAVVARRDVLAFLDVLGMVLRNVAVLRDLMLPYEHWNLEQLLHLHLRANGLVQRVAPMPYTMYSVRSPDGPTRWSRGVPVPGEDFLVKYPAELRKARFTRQVLRLGGWNRATMAAWHTAVRCSRVAQGHPARFPAPGRYQQVIGPHLPALP